MSERISIVAGNWKMHKTRAETRDLIRELVTGLSTRVMSTQIIVAPPFIAIADAIEEIQGAAISVSAQNMHWEEQGAFTGEISGTMLKSAGCEYVIIGHSERRQFFGETDSTVNLKIKSAIKHDLAPIFCLGETLSQREGGSAFQTVQSQLKQGLQGVAISDFSKLIIAYEPVWAIGTGRTASPEQAQEVHQFLRAELGTLVGQNFADEVRILYGGSVKPENTRSLIESKDIDGFLVGGASLKSEQFLGIIREVG